LESLAELNKINNEINIEDKITSLCHQATEKMELLISDAHRLVNMTTVIVGIFIKNGQIIFFNCGDCRVYRFINSYLAKTTHDNSVVQALFDEGLIEEEGMQIHPLKNILTSDVSREKKRFKYLFFNYKLCSLSKIFYL
jgi:protein phosphatase